MEGGVGEGEQVFGCGFARFHAFDELVCSQWVAGIGRAAEALQPGFFVRDGEQVRPAFGPSGFVPEGDIENRRRFGSAEVGGGTGPWPRGGVRGEAGADGVALDVAQGGPEVVLVHRTGVEAVLPEVAGAAFAGVEILRVAAVSAAQDDGERIRLRGHEDEVDVIGHEAVAEDGDAVVPGVVFEELEVEPVVFGAEVCGLAVVTALGDVVGDAWENQARRTWHTRIVGNSPETFSGVCRNCGEVPPRIYGGRGGTEVFDPIGHFLA
jgi:hypothetical protein